MHKLVSYTVIIVFIVVWLLLYYRNNFLIPKILREFKESHNKSTNLLKIIVPLLEKHNIQYFIEAGTCLGYARHNKTYIPWDDDIDLGVVYTNTINKNIKNMKKDLDINNIKLVKMSWGYKLINKKTWIDLIFYCNNNNNIYYSKDFYNYYPQDILFPLKKDYFDGVLVNIPNNYKKYLKITYGKDCLKYYKLTKLHKRYLDNIISFVLQEFPIYVKT